MPVPELAGAKPLSWRLLTLLMLMRLAGALYAPIMDCDETYNYYEPMHYLLYGYGLQTWEYSPAYALRSYFYLLVPHGAVALTASLLTTHKVVVFYVVRCSLGVACAACTCRVRGSAVAVVPRPAEPRPSVPRRGQW